MWIYNITRLLAIEMSHIAPINFGGVEMTVYQLAEELGISHHAITGIINRKCLPYRVAIVGMSRGPRRVRYLPPATVQYIREYQERRSRGHEMESSAMTRFFKALVMARKMAGEPIDVGGFMNDYRNGGWRNA